MNEKNIEPHRFKKGEPSANPNGRPKKGNAVADAFNDLLDAKGAKMEYYLSERGSRTITIDTPETIRKALALVVMRKALDGDLCAVKEVYDRTGGRPAQAVDVTSKGDSITGPAIYLPDNNRNK